MGGGTTIWATGALLVLCMGLWATALLPEIVTALLKAGLRLDLFTEHQSVPWNAMPGQMVEIGAGEWQLVEAPERLAATYTITATKVAPET